ncbi:MAG TPA: DUF255 domain-containing protein [Candidatus Limnocylindria bacterium]|nr:DUF255 domain-containing protein [Candidatus Limnocylindria bacterium]
MSEFRFSPRPNRASEIKWRSWGDAAFAEAREQGKPVLLAISAVWCHWCHVMDETSYSIPEIIEIINDRYVPVRVDNDERPDVNRRYNMGGWPSTVFLTPEGEIIHGGTYVPPDQMWQAVNGVNEVWTTKRDEITARVAELHEEEAKARKPVPDGAPAKKSELSPDIIDTVGALVRGQYDPQFGGFGRSPKFPQVRLLRFLLDEYRRHGYPDVAHMLHKTLAAMATSGMHDKIEGGFFRYATTREWEIPHYEKMLEDNSELLAVYAEAHRTFPQAGYDRVVRDIVRWMDTVLWREDVKAFAGSQDADEVYYELDAQGREKHGAPFVDKTLYTGWNALAISAYLAAADALSDPLIRQRGIGVLKTIATKMWDPKEGLAHFDRGEGPRVRDLLVDLAAVLTAQLDAYETGEHQIGIVGAQRVAMQMHERLMDADNGGFFDAPAREEPGRVGLREKPIEDNAMAADALLRLAALSGDGQWRETAVRALRSFVGTYRGWGQFASSYANAMARALTEPLTITVVGPKDDETATALWSAARAVDDPARSIQRIVPEDDGARLEELGFPPDRTAAYVCVGTTCSAPLTEVASLRGELERARGRLERV